MGQFSWVTSNTKQRIIIDGCMPVALIDNKNRLYKEENYQGYGVFGGKDAYALLAEMNVPEECTGETRHDRLVGINLQYSGKTIAFPIKIVELIPGREYFYDRLDEAEDDPFQGWEIEDDPVDDENTDRWY